LETIVQLITDTDKLIKQGEYDNALDLINKIIALVPADLKKIIYLTKKVSEYIQGDDLESTRDGLNNILFELAFLQIRKPVKKSYPPASPDKIVHNLSELGFAVEDYEIDIDDYRNYFQSSRYMEKFLDYYPCNLTEKSLEHYIAAKLLGLDEKDVYIDIASEGSPAPIIYNNLFGTKTFRQDLSYLSEFDGKQFGGDAAKMPVPDEFATKMALHCSFEHFEGDSDIGFIREADRVLKPGGIVCIVPLYLADEHSIVTNPVIAVSQNVRFEDKLIVCCVKEFNNRFGRFYDPGTLKRRIQNNIGDMRLTIYRITNAQFDPSCYVQFAALLQKPADRTTPKFEKSKQQPPDELFEARKKIANLVLERDRYKTWVPPGHIYSPVPSIEEIKMKDHNIFHVIPAKLLGIDLNEEGQLQLFGKFKEYYKEQPFNSEKQDHIRYFFDNTSYSYSDAIVLYCMIRHVQPKRIIEIGSGYSSCVTLDTNEIFFTSRVSCAFIDPYPELLLSLIKESDKDKIELISLKLQDVPLNKFSDLSANDILFIDSTHVVKTGGDLNYIFFEILPNLKNGVYIHFHNIFYPFEYPKEWIYEGRAWNEAYFLRAFLQYNNEFRIQFFNTFLAHFHKDKFMHDMPLCLKNSGSSIWIKKVLNY
jgi:SAM-dependent methyltransferase